MNWYVLLDGQQIGPLTSEAVRQMIHDHQLRKTDLVWNETLPDWIEAGSVRDLYSPGERLAARPARSPGQQLYQKSAISANRKRLLLPASVLLTVVILVIATVFIYRALNRDPDQNQQSAASQTTTMATSDETLQINPEPDFDRETDDASNLPVQATGNDEHDNQPEETSETETEAEDPDQTSQAETDLIDTEPEESTTEDTTLPDDIIPDSESILPVETIMDIMHQADKIALDLFRAAFEAELADEEKVPFSQIRPDLLLYRSRHHVDTDLAVFYEEGLFEWGFEMNQVFPFHDMEHLQESFRGIVSQTGQSIVVYTVIEGSALNEGYSFYTVLILEDNKWVIDEQYSGS